MFQCFAAKWCLRLCVAGLVLSFYLTINRPDVPTATFSNVRRLSEQSNTIWFRHLGRQTRFGSAEKSSLNSISTSSELDKSAANALEELQSALGTMQSNYFELWLGTWPESIDWTAAVLGTYISASLSSLSRSVDYLLPPALEPTEPTSLQSGRIENEINKYFSQTISYYFGENALDIRYEAYDDMLWVVLGWLENIRFIDLHSKAHHSHVAPSGRGWYGQQFSPAFAHRARVFFDLAKKGWDTRLCGGGMVWNPRLQPYKNAITNQLFISASVSMYLHFPGDGNRSPFFSDGTRKHLKTNTENTNSRAFWDWDPSRPHNPAHLKYAVEAYSWLSSSNMTNSLGLFVDGFHIRDYGVNGTIGSGKCDVRNEMVYTYNQGVILSGVRGLWEGTGQKTYLEDGHRLVRSVLRATGWDLSTSRPATDDGWAGIGRNGVLEEVCDSTAGCSQDGQTFKGIFFHHLTLFCNPLPLHALIPGVSFGADKDLASLHNRSCHEYAAWVAHNAVAAMNTRDSKGRFGMWWSAQKPAGDWISPIPKGAVDYRNDHIVLDSGPWSCNGHSSTSGDDDAKVRQHRSHDLRPDRSGEDPSLNNTDSNDRGRGRTVETQGGGVAVVRALWEFLHL